MTNITHVGGKDDKQGQSNHMNTHLSREDINYLSRILTNNEIYNIIQQRNSSDSGSDSDSNERIRLNLEGNPCLKCSEITDNPRYEQACEVCRDELFNYDMPDEPSEDYDVTIVDRTIRRYGKNGKNKNKNKTRKHKKKSKSKLVNEKKRKQKKTKKKK